uniref:Uncharacterized protein n=1 Tax=Panagrellus redivivus TaxID=6233 RepID=A0A7E4VC79_PANRE
MAPWPIDTVLGFIYTAFFKCARDCLTKAIGLRHGKNEALEVDDDAFPNICDESRKSNDEICRLHASLNQRCPFPSTNNVSIL